MGMGIDESLGRMGLDEFGSNESWVESGRAFLGISSLSFYSSLIIRFLFVFVRLLRFRLFFYVFVSFFTFSSVF